MISFGSSIQAQPENEHDYQYIEFWSGFACNVDIASVLRDAVSVKGQSYENPLRFLEVFENSFSDKSNQSVLMEDEISEIFFPNIPGVDMRIGPDFYQPPFIWKDCSADTLCRNFTYNTNAIYRILTNLSIQEKIPQSKVPDLLDKACLLLSKVYRHQNNHVIKHINNNFNMYLITRVMEVLLGKSIYNVDSQEPSLVKNMLAQALSLVKQHKAYSLKDKIGIAIGKGITFFENQENRTISRKEQDNHVLTVSHHYYGRQLAIDHRDVFIDKIVSSEQNGSFMLAVVLDDVAESVDDFLWIQELISRYSHLSINVILNTAQVSINFSSEMLNRVLKGEEFRSLATLNASRLKITETYCPLISFQENCLSKQAKKCIEASDVVYVKGANFFETLQFKDKECFYGFVVYGPVSRTYTGLKDNDAVFAYVPKGCIAYSHHVEPGKIVSLKEIV